jgi:PTH1 family peptidyl-tRNA hydrolase
MYLFPATSHLPFALSHRGAIMKIIAGLGNPGDQYRMTRHNMGFLVLDALADDAGIAGRKKKFDALIGDGRLGGHRVILVKPQTFMNLSGQSLRQVVDFYQITPEDLIVVHDDLDLPFGTVRIKVGGGDGGHKGVRSAMDHLGGGAFTRVRLGIGKPSFKDDTEDYVLQRFPKTDLETLAEVVRNACEAVREILDAGARSAMNRFNTRERKAAPEADNNVK